MTKAPAKASSTSLPPSQPAKEEEKSQELANILTQLKYAQLLESPEPESSHLVDIFGKSLGFQSQNMVSDSIATTRPKRAQRAVETPPESDQSVGAASDVEDAPKPKQRKRKSTKHTEGNDAEPGSKYVPTKHECPTCNKLFQRKHDLTRHERIHLGIKPFICQRCGKTFVRKDALKRHESMDAGIRRFRCAL